MRFVFDTKSGVKRKLQGAISFPLEIDMGLYLQDFDQKHGPTSPHKPQQQQGQNSQILEDIYKPSAPMYDPTKNQNILSPHMNQMKNIHSSTEVKDQNQNPSNNSLNATSDKSLRLQQKTPLN